MKYINVLALFLVLSFAQMPPARPTAAFPAAAPTTMPSNTCTSGACCNIYTKRLKGAGELCAVSHHPCMTPGEYKCDGKSPKCHMVFKADGTFCLVNGVCKSGICYKNGVPAVAPPKSYPAIALRSLGTNAVRQQMALTMKTQPRPQPPAKKEEKKEVVIEDPIIVHEYDDAILETLRHIPTLARLRHEKHAIEEKKVKAFRKLTHLVLRKQTEQLENAALSHRHSKARLQDELQDESNLHRHLHLHHKQHHGLDNTTDSTITEMGQALLQTTNGSGPSSFVMYVIVALAVVAVILVVVIIISIIKASKAKPRAKRDHY